MSTDRVIIQRKASETLIPLITDLMKSFTAGDPQKHEITALFNEGSAVRLAGFLDEAKQAGAELVLGDGRREGGVVQPTIVMNSKPGMKIWDRESFGPGKSF